MDSNELSVPTETQMLLSASLQADLVPWKEWGGACVGITGCSDKERCQQVLDCKWCPQARLADVQATWLPEICSLKRHCSFIENLARAGHLAHLVIYSECFQVTSATGQKTSETYLVLCH